jgi:diguanylate cyclase (GGDEF)-like protein
MSLPFAVLLAAAALALLGALAVSRLSIGRLRHAAVEAARIDPLTGLPNRRELLRLLAGPEEGRGRGEGVAVLLDLDHFRRLNADRGAEAGDAALLHIVDRLQRLLRPGQLVGRWSGDEFLILLPDGDVAAGAALAERIRTVIEQTAWEWEEKEVVLTGTLAVTTWADDEPVDSVAQAIEQAMLDGKQRGRNRVAAASHVRLPSSPASPGAGTPTPRSTVARSIIR